MPPMEDIHPEVLVVASPGSTACTSMIPDAEMLSSSSASSSSPHEQESDDSDSCSVVIVDAPRRVHHKNTELRNQEERTCHMMPCSIDYQGMASTHVYFRPVEADGVLSSTFRGRGLLALAPTTKSNNMMDEKMMKDDTATTMNTTTDDRYLKAVLLSVQNQQVQVKAEIDEILEWQHEHNPETLFLHSSRSSNATSGSPNPSRVQVAHDWCDVALALHEAIPVEEVPVA